MTLSVVEASVLPPPPEHVRVYVVVATGETISLPERDLLPLHPFDATHVLAFAEAHVRVEVAPSLIKLGSALKETVGATGIGVTPIVTDSASLPPSPSQVSMYVVVAVGLTISLPLTSREPFQPPEAVHESACVEFQLNVDVAPSRMPLGTA
jgi:hypothetical protein